MARIGLTPDELLLATWSGGTAPRYAAQLPRLNVLAGETLALVGTGTQDLLVELADALPRCLWVEGGEAAAGGVLRVHAQQGARVGVESVAITDPFTGISDEARALALADIAGLGNLGLTVVVEAPDATLAALAADRICLVRDGEPLVTYPVLAPAPRTEQDVAAVTDRVTARLAAALG